VHNCGTEKSQTYKPHQAASAPLSGFQSVASSVLDPSQLDPGLVCSIKNTCAGTMNVPIPPAVIQVINQSKETNTALKPRAIHTRLSTTIIFSICVNALLSQGNSRLGVPQTKNVGHNCRSFAGRLSSNQHVTVLKKTSKPK